ncbi:DUF4194 domain-containing protein [Clostridium sp. KNHs205]|uniref:DUF4194 domain-containing protein n=1 Tax=Clostridium sp. KNHs205 TaxID=1449050 RepID=UPI00051BBA4D|nr:DUF4194 domain-containing protein [Clostridium sp. KNHs205]
MFNIFEESVVQKERFRLAANRLLNQCFLVKKKESTKKDYMFVYQNRELFIPYFELLGYQLKINEDQGVIGLVNQFGAGRLSMNKYESIMLLLLRLLYLEKRRELGTFSEEVTVLMEEIREKYAMLKIKSKPVMDKSMERTIITAFRKYNLVLNLESDISQADARIIIYPSIVMAVQMEDVSAYYDQIKDRLASYSDTGGEEDGETEEITDEDSAD